MVLPGVRLPGRQVLRHEEDQNDLKKKEDNGNKEDDDDHDHDDKIDDNDCLGSILLTTRFPDFLSGTGYVMGEEAVSDLYR